MISILSNSVAAALIPLRTKRPLVLSKCKLLSLKKHVFEELELGAYMGYCICIYIYIYIEQK